MAVRHLLPPVPRYFKANLHTHTTVSDGRLTPQEVKDAYKARGYQIIAFTDHEVCIPHPELVDEEFLPLTSYELAFNPKGVYKFLRKTYHLCFIAKDPGNRWQVYDPTLVVGNSGTYADQVVCDGFEDRDYSLEQVNDVIARANAQQDQETLPDLSHNFTVNGDGSGSNSCQNSAHIALLI